jgi:hypothetical protein
MSGDRDDDEDDPFLPEDITELPIGIGAKAAIARMAADGKIISIRTSKGRAILRLHGELERHEATAEQRESAARQIRAYRRYLTGTIGVSVKHAVTMVDQSSRNGPPKVAEFCLALFLNKTRGEAMIGDLGERFEQDCQRFGAQRARRLYWSRTLKSLWPLLRRGAARAFKWGVVVESVRRFF